MILLLMHPHSCKFVKFSVPHTILHVLIHISQQTLIEKEWLAFGHKFTDRCGHIQGDSKEVSPIFTQFIGEYILHPKACERHQSIVPFTLLNFRYEMCND